MIIRKSFFIRWLSIRNEETLQEEKSVIDIEHIQTGKVQRVSNLEEASQWMREMNSETGAKEQGLKKQFDSSNY